MGMKQAIFFTICLLAASALADGHAEAICTEEDYPTEFAICNTVELYCETTVAACDGLGDVCLNAVSSTMDIYINAFDFSAVGDCECREFTCTSEGVVVGDSDSSNNSAASFVASIGLIGLMKLF